MDLPTEGLIEYSENAAPMPCAILNFSATGANLRAKELARVPNNFHLRLEHEGVSANCKVVWRSGTEIGVEFRNELHAV